MSSLDDMEVLKDIINGNKKIKDLDEDVKIRLIKLCQKRSQQLDKKIENKDKDLKMLEEMINIIK